MAFRIRRIGLTAAALFSMTAVVAGQHGQPPHAAAKPPKTTTGTHGSNPTNTTIGARIASHPQLAAKLTPLLPKGMTLEAAAAGFKNQGQFIAALHVSHNLDIPFVTLKSEMTGDHPKSLGQAIQNLRPTTDAKAAVKKAEKQAHDDESSSDR